MKSSMGITKIAAVRFMLVLHLFLNVKMCVVDGGAAGMPSSDSDINYDDGDSGEWQSSSSSSSSMSSVEGGNRSKELPPSSPWSLGGLPVPSNLIRWNDPPSADPRPHHGHVRSRMHHVRHEQHYLQGHHRASKPNKWHSVSEVDSIHRDGPTVVHDEKHQKGRHGHQNHHNKHHNHHRTAGTSSTESSEEASVTRHDHRHRQQLTDFLVPKDVLSIERGASLGPRKHYQQVANRKRSTSNFHSEPPSMNALEHTFPSKQERDPQTTKNATSKSQYTLRSANPESKSYFEYLLNNYKSHSPLYKEHNAQQQKLQTVQPQTRSLTKAKQQRGSGSSSTGSSSSSNQKASSSKSSKGKQLDSEYDYSYEDEDDDEVQNDGAYGEVVQTTTSRPRRTTTTVATTTTTTTEASQESSSSSDGDQGSGGGGVGDNQYALFVQSATRMKNTNHRNGNNKFSSHSKHATSPNNPVDPAKQVLVPRPYSSITDFKQANFGTKEAVERSFRIYRNHNQEVQAHLERVARLGACKVPKPKVIPVPSNGTYYFLPERTILHRCDDETACCEPPKRCEAKHTETVTLYFYVSIGM
ncbi:uncharacterized protein LOC126570763 isoform X2 [Anopheles aquasalis]|uniref:uncharacterized protein LOC126570763 isoform X2 n=1 Tax=Anopheles aquasalis TaxID=42839 RepID=UPI00215A1B6A|nr:uncharacterized protein LOC126570763 isoform X2 [Anopheles aquasalis]